MKHVLIISFVFPPSPGIGGRRWAKFAKYFSKKGVVVSVITAKPQSKEVSSWEKDLEGIDLNRQYFDSGYPVILGSYPNSLLDKLKYRVQLTLAKLRIRGNYYDRSIYSEKNLVEKIMELFAQKPFQKLIISGGPFAYLHSVAKLKSKLPEVEFIVDFRDPWTNNQTAFGFENLLPKRLAVEKEMEENVIRTFDKVITVSDSMSEYFTQYRLSGINTIPNGFDPEDFPSGHGTDKEGADGNRIVFVGTVYDKSTPRIFEFLDYLPKGFSLDIYGSAPVMFDRALAKYPNAKFHGRVPLAEAHDRIREADFVLLALTEDINYSFSTKFCEYVAMEKRIIICSNEGPTAQYIVNHRIGFHFRGPQDSASLSGYLAEPPALADYAQVKSQFDISNLTNQLMDILWQ